MFSSICDGVSIPVNFKSFALTNTTGFAASTKDTSISPYPVTSILSIVLPVGNNFPVDDPAVSEKSIVISEPVPGTPAML